jgi:hypothetical protein
MTFHMSSGADKRHLCHQHANPNSALLDPCAATVVPSRSP